jgi:hypothetical protein
MSCPRSRAAAPLALVLALSLGCEGEPRDFLGGGGPGPIGTTPARLAFRLGDIGEDQISDLAVDAAGAVYITGTFTGSVDFDPGSGLRVLTSFGGTDGFVAKYSATNTLVWATRFGGSGEEAPRALAVEPGGDVLIAGWFEGTPDFDDGPGTAALTSAGARDGFVAKFSTTGTLAWVRRFGGTSADELVDVASSGGVVYAAGNFQGAADGAPGGTGSVGPPGLGQDLAILTFESSGNARGAFLLGGPGDERLSGIAVTGSTFLISGTFGAQLDFDSSAVVVARQAIGVRDGFLAAYTSTGVLQWLRTIGGTGEVSVTENGLSFGGGTVQLIGTFTGTVDLDSGSGVTSAQSLGLEDMFVVRTDASGGLTDAFTVGSTGSEAPLRAAVDGSDLLLAGTFTSPLDVDPGSGTTVLTPLGAVGGTETFVVRYTASGQVVWAHGFGPSTPGTTAQTTPFGLATGVGGQVVFGGRFLGAMDVDPSSSIFALNSFGNGDGFVVRLTSTGSLAAAP